MAGPQRPGVHAAHLRPRHRRWFGDADFLEESSQEYPSTMGVPGMIGLLAFAAFATRFGLTGAIGGLFAVLLVRLIIGAVIGRQRPD